MDSEEEGLQFLGFFGIYREAYNIITSRRKIFSQITLAFVLPLSFIYLAQTKISDLFFPKMMHNQEKELLTFFAYFRLSSEFTAFLIFKVMYLIFLLVLSLFSTSAIVYTVACAYTTKEITFVKVASVVPTVWKRLMITFLWTSIVMFLYNFFTMIILFFLVVPVSLSHGGRTPAAIDILSNIVVIIWAIGFVYVSVIWHLASVVSVLEESYGYKAFLKSKALIKGLMGKVILGLFCFSLLSILISFALVIQTVVYFVCKSYHHENIDKSCLDEHLDAYNLGDYVPLIKDKDIQLEQSSEV
ncbi:uncharacterized protein LOC113285868 [Papaver somniferum]|uniref:uncharacterized protein LOC113285868 n=1 Tax=Papaver somniferum TaxID=3469 RepID=UPI000E6F5856|nr:uncharacterized protein LOC113285868 [Papaver somniferum]